MTAFVGNDLIDFAAAHNRGRAEQPRYLERVLSVAERGRMVRENGGDHGFALLWSAKEAAWKAATKRCPEWVFAPRQWEVEIDSLAFDPVERAGTVTIAPDTRVAVRWRRGGGWVHCVASIGDAPGRVDEDVAEAIDLARHDAFSARERRGFSCRESAAARTLAKRLLERRGIGGIEIVRAPGVRGLLPPRVCAGEMALPDVDLSLSHDGRFVAAVIAVDPRVIVSAGRRTSRDRRRAREGGCVRGLATFAGTPSARPRWQVP